VSLKAGFKYLKNFIEDRDVAAILPSSGFTIKKILNKIDFDEVKVIVELGPGDGVISKAIIEKLPADSHIILIEKIGDFEKDLKALNHKRPDVEVSTYIDEAQNLEAILAEYNLQKIDHVVSGIPFSWIDDPTKHQILETCYKMLKPKGNFIAYQTSGALVKHLNQAFSKTYKEVELLDIPPMVIMEATK